MRKIPLLIVLILIFACGGGGIEGYVGESIILTVDNPEEGKDVDFMWALIEQPDGSLLNSSDLKTTETGKKMTFSPDYPGKYVLEVFVTQYGDELSSQNFTFNISDHGKENENEEQDDEDDKVDEKNYEEWLNEKLDDTNENISDEEDVNGEEDVDGEKDVEGEEELEIGTENEPTLAKIEEPKKGASIMAKTDRFTIQITAKRNLKDAQAFVANMIDKGYDAYIQKAVFDTNEIWYRVRVGSYDNYNAATTASKVISKELNFSTWVDFVRHEQ